MNCVRCGHNVKMHNRYGYCCVGRVAVSGLAAANHSICECRYPIAINQWLVPLCTDLGLAV